jgi:hypothetical protein
MLGQPVRGERGTFHWSSGKCLAMLGERNGQREGREERRERERERERERAALGKGK